MAEGLTIRQAGMHAGMHALESQPHSEVRRRTGVYTLVHEGSLDGERAAGMAALDHKRSRIAKRSGRGYF